MLPPAVGRQITKAFPGILQQFATKENPDPYVFMHPRPIYEGKDVIGTQLVPWYEVPPASIDLARLSKYGLLFNIDGNY